VIILDLNQVMIANLMVSLGGHKVDVDENILRHMILNSIRYNLVKFGKEYGELVIACDDKNYWRRNIFPYYKAGRKKSREQSDLDWNSIFQSLNKIRDELKEYFPYRTIQVETAEADDVIGALCAKYGRELGGDAILILSGDKDFQQLQKYSNVSQYDPVRKRWIKCNDPDSFLNEHIMKGDVGDGVPNVLSADDTFVSDSRQKPLRVKKMHELLNTEGSEWPQEIYQNFCRNRMLIDLKEIPERIINQVYDQYDNQDGKSRDKLFNYFIKNKLKNLMENISEF